MKKALAWMLCFMLLAALLPSVRMTAGRAAAEGGWEKENWEKKTPQPPVSRPTPYPGVRVTPAGGGNTREKINVYLTFTLADGTIVGGCEAALPVHRGSRRSPEGLQYAVIQTKDVEKLLPDGYELDPRQPDPIGVVLPEGDAVVDVTVIVRKAAENHIVIFHSMALVTFAPEGGQAPRAYLYDEQGNLVAVTDEGRRERDVPAGFEQKEGNTVARRNGHQEAVLRKMSVSENDAGEREITGAAAELGGRLILPYGITAIGAGAFRDHQGLLSVVVVRTVTSIGPGAFRDCGKLERVILPAAVTIAQDAFDGISDEAVFFVPEGSASQRWCQQNGKTFETYPDGPEKG